MEIKIFVKEVVGEEGEGFAWILRAHALTLFKVGAIMQRLLKFSY